jgi:hypothetical protein
MPFCRSGRNPAMSPAARKTVKQKKNAMTISRKIYRFKVEGNTNFASLDFWKTPFFLSNPEA